MKEEFTDKQMVEFLRKSYCSVDGLWFLKTEEKHGFEEAMEQDEAVWDVMSKIQARRAKAVLGLEGKTLEDLAKAFALKLAAEGHSYNIEVKGSDIEISISLCPWYEGLRSSNRTHMSETISQRICMREFSGWVNEFAPEMEFKLEGRLCVEADGCEACKMRFHSL